MSDSLMNLSISMCPATVGSVLAVKHFASASNFSHKLELSPSSSKDDSNCTLRVSSLISNVIFCFKMFTAFWYLFLSKNPNFLKRECKIVDCTKTSFSSFLRKRCLQSFFNVVTTLSTSGEKTVELHLRCRLFNITFPSTITFDDVT
ncbi:hypothetical protein PGB90_006943 [Kerria lacca]